jgi:hypothetical protein
VRIISRAALDADLDAAIDATSAGWVVLPTGLRADFDALLSDARALFAAFLTGRPAVLVDRLAVFTDCLFITSI